MIEKTECFRPAGRVVFKKTMNQNESGSLKSNEADQHLADREHFSGSPDQILSPHRAHQPDLKKEKANDDPWQEAIKRPWFAQDGDGCSERSQPGHRAHDEFPIVSCGLARGLYRERDNIPRQDTSENAEDQSRQGLELPRFFRQHRAKLLNGRM